MYHREWQRMLLIDFVDHAPGALELRRIADALNLFDEEARGRNESLPVAITVELYPSGESAGYGIYCNQQGYAAPIEMLYDLAWISGK